MTASVCLSETWCEYVQIIRFNKNVFFCIFLYFLCNTLSYKIRSHLNMKSDAIKCLCLEISIEKSKNIVLGLNYRPLNGDTTLLEKRMKNVLSKNDATKKEVILIGDFNMNFLDFDKNKSSKFCEFNFSIWIDFCDKQTNICHKGHCYFN